MRVSLKIRYEDEVTGQEVVKPFCFKTKNVSTFEPSDVYDDHTFIQFDNGTCVEDIIPFFDFQNHVMPPDVKWLKPV